LLSVPPPPPGATLPRQQPFAPTSDELQPPCDYLLCPLRIHDQKTPLCRRCIASCRRVSHTLRSPSNLTPAATRQLHAAQPPRARSPRRSHRIAPTDIRPWRSPPADRAARRRSCPLSLPPGYSWNPPGLQPHSPGSRGRCASPLYIYTAQPPCFTLCNVEPRHRAAVDSTRTKRRAPACSAPACIRRARLDETRPDLVVEEL
jgi:hypothetical protein